DAFEAFLAQRTGCFASRLALREVALAMKGYIVAGVECRGDPLVPAAGEGVHGKAIGDQHAVIVQRAANEIADEGRNRGRQVWIDLRENEMRHHRPWAVLETDEGQEIGVHHLLD